MLPFQSLEHVDGPRQEARREGRGEFVSLALEEAGANYVDMARQRVPFSNADIWRHYPELDLPAPKHVV